MKLVVSHADPDFDALASLALARLAHPGAVAVLLGRLDERVGAFVHLYRDRLELKHVKNTGDDANSSTKNGVDDINFDDVDELIVVDTSSPTRIAPFDALLGRVHVTLYDHHPRGERAVAAAGGIHKAVGATATLLTLLLKSQGVSIPADLASLGLLGIHDDTGGFSYALTGADDHEAAAHLLRAGANLEVVNDFAGERYSDAQRDFFSRLLRCVREEEVNGYRVVVAGLELDDTEAYVPGVAPLCTELLELHGADAALVGLARRGKVRVIARSRGNTINVGAALAEAFGSGGHPGAASARSEEPLQEALTKALSAFSHHSRPARTARDVMSRPVRTVRADEAVKEAQETLLRYGHNGLPVLGAEGELVGVISRRDLERAGRHGLARSKVSGFMTKEVVTADEGTPLRELETLVETHDIGRVPILHKGELVGIVTRTDLIAARHEGDETAQDSAQRPPDRAQEILESLPSAALEVLEKSEKFTNSALYLVGGTVRDALLRTGMQDLDLVVEGGSAEALGKALQETLSGHLMSHADFGTCTLELESGLLVDIAGAREEFYIRPGALPQVSPGTLRKDLARRDFTVNALALRLVPAPAALLDPYNGLGDLEARVLRALHPLSFVEDPTRILRGARLGGRLGFAFHPATSEQISLGLEPAVLGGVSPSRLRGELLLTLAEPRVAPALELLENCGALSAMFDMHLNAPLNPRPPHPPTSPSPDLPTSDATSDTSIFSALETLDTLRQEGPVPDESYLLLLLLSVPDARAEAHRERFGWPKRLLDARATLEEAARAHSLSEEKLEAATPALKAALKTLHPTLRRTVERLEASSLRQKLRGQDVLDLGLSPGPEVGAVLRRVAAARLRGEVGSFEEELELAQSLVRASALEQESS